MVPALGDHLPGPIAPRASEGRASPTAQGRPRRNEPIDGANLLARTDYFDPPLANRVARPAAPGWGRPSGPTAARHQGYPRPSVALPRGDTRPRPNEPNGRVPTGAIAAPPPRRRTKPTRPSHPPGPDPSRPAPSRTPPGILSLFCRGLSHRIRIKDRRRDGRGRIAVAKVGRRPRPGRVAWGRTWATRLAADRGGGQHTTGSLRIGPRHLFRMATPFSNGGPLHCPLDRPHPSSSPVGRRLNGCGKIKRRAATLVGSRAVRAGTNGRGWPCSPHPCRSARSGRSSPNTSHARSRRLRSVSWPATRAGS